MRRPLSLIALASLTLSGAFAQGADDCANAQPITGLGPHPFDNTSATATPGLADCNGLPVRKDVWFLWTAPSTARITFDVCGQTTLETRVAIYDGIDCNNLGQITCGSIDCSAGSQIRFPATAGQQFLIRLGSKVIGETGTGTFTLSEFVPTLNPNNGRYYEVVPENVSWPEARDRAASSTWLGLPGRLAVLSNQADLDWVVNNLSLGRPWIGLYQDTNHPQYSEPSGGWVWINGTDATFTNWAAGEPNNIAAGGGAENYAEMYGNGEWNDAEENHFNTTHFLVEYGGGGLGSNYCAANPNSTGIVSSMSAGGSITVADNNLSLSAIGLPSNSFGFFITSRTQGFAGNPGGSQGNLCLSGSIGRFQQQIVNSGSSGSFSIQADLTAFPDPALGTVGVLPGDTWNFQAWHRDAVGGSTTSNFTDGLEVTFQ
jgi:hypothetical protein